MAMTIPAPRRPYPGAHVVLLGAVDQLTLGCPCGTGVDCSCGYYAEPDSKGL